jgi:hypothetical protein
LPSQTSPEHLSFFTEETLIPLDVNMLDHGPSSLSPDVNLPHKQVAQSVVDKSLTKQLTTKKKSQKRAPKSPTISAKKWDLHKDRIRQLYVTEKKSFNKLRDVMNQELGIMAT